MMRQVRYWCWVTGVCLVVLVGCRPATQDDLPPTATTEAIVIDPLVTPTSEPFLPTVPPTPFTLPTATNNPNLDLPQDWREFGQRMMGFTLAAPAGWSNIGQSENIQQIAQAVGEEEVLFVADSLTAGIQLLNQQPVQGAFLIGFQVKGAGLELIQLQDSRDPVSALELITSRFEPAAVPITPLRLVNFPSAYADLTQDPFGLFPAGSDIRLRLALFLRPETNTPTFLLMGADKNSWSVYEPIFNYALETVIIYDQTTTVPEGVRFLSPTAENNFRDSVVGQLQKDQLDFWLFNGESGQYVTLTLVPSGGATDLTLTLLAPSGRTVVQQDSGYGGDSEVLADVLLPESGAYIVQVSEFFNEADSYFLTLVMSNEPIYSSGGRIELGQEIQTTLRAGDEDEWVFAGQAGQTLSIILTPAGEFDPLFVLYTPDGNEIATFDEGYSGDAEILAGYTLPQTGDYRVVVKSFADNGGDYTLAVDEGDQQIANFYEAGDLIYGEVMKEILQEDEAHAWFFSGRAGDEITLRVVPVEETLDLDVWLLAPDTRRLVMQDQSMSGEAELINFLLPRDGQYIVVVQDFFGERGEYEIELIVSEENYLVSAGTLSFGLSLEAAVQPGRGAMWTFEGVEGNVITLELTPVSPETNLILSLRDPKGQPTMQVDTAAAGEVELLVDYTLTSTGTWTIVVQESFDSGGSYKLKLTKQ